MKHSVIRLFIVFGLALALASCAESNVDVTQNGIDPTDPVVKHILSLGFELQDLTAFPEYYIVEGDIVFFKNMELPNQAISTEHRRTLHWVSEDNRDISIYLNTSSFSNYLASDNEIDLTPYLGGALTMAIDAFNGLNLDLHFDNNAINAASADIVIQCGCGSLFIEGSIGCGQAGWPSPQGKPYKTINIFPEIGNNSVSRLAATIIHEIGHCIGFRHTTAPGESGYINIPGNTPDGGSFMNSTCGTQWTGFTPGDIAALECIYGINSTCVFWCNDGIQNGDETGVDCGGSCNPCISGPTCNDGIQNGNETGVDCGGSCPPCPLPPNCTNPITPRFIFVSTDNSNYFNAAASLFLGDNPDGYEWSVTGGFIISGQGTSQISIGPDCPSPRTITINMRAYNDSQAGRCYSGYKTTTYQWTGPCFF